ncbi:hypothetical protein BDZ88DRAFT_417813 [Geranomyces variabilis]|nr:hypothetical protein BDZ88DRAFT_417813 [Geranomyces variabilis]
MCDGGTRAAVEVTGEAVARVAPLAAAAEWPMPGVQPRDGFFSAWRHSEPWPLGLLKSTRSSLRRRDSDCPRRRRKHTNARAVIRTAAIAHTIAIIGPTPSAELDVLAPTASEVSVAPGVAPKTELEVMSPLRPLGAGTRDREVGSTGGSTSDATGVGVERVRVSVTMMSGGADVGTTTGGADVTAGGGTTTGGATGVFTGGTTTGGFVGWTTGVVGVSAGGVGGGGLACVGFGVGGVSGGFERDAMLLGEKGVKCGDRASETGKQGMEERRRSGNHTPSTSSRVVVVVGAVAPPPPPTARVPARPLNSFLAFSSSFGIRGPAFCRPLCVQGAETCTQNPQVPHRRTAIKISLL